MCRQNGEAGQVDGEVVLLERCESDVTVSKQNSRNKAKQERFLCVKKVFFNSIFIVLLCFTLLSFPSLQTSTSISVNVFIDNVTVNKLFSQGTTILRQSLLTDYFAERNFGSGRTTFLKKRRTAKLFYNIVLTTGIKFKYRKLN